MKNKCLDYFIKLLDITEMPTLTANTYKPISNKEIPPIVGNATKNIDSHLGKIHANFQQDGG